MSALTQDYKNTEVICVDNESGDNSYQLIKNIQKEYPRLKLSTAPNIYRYSWEEPVEAALKLSTGDYFTILGSDDYIRGDYITNIVKIISAAPDKIKLLQSPLRGVSGPRQEFVEEIKHSYKSLEEFKRLLFHRCPVTTPTVVYDKKLHDAGIIRWNSKDYLGAVDYDLYFNIADHGFFIYPYPEWIGYSYRWHTGQATWGMRQENTNYDQLIQQYWREKWKPT
jgi:glycosyltransferase involved in cell wall biosynthesis